MLMSKPWYAKCDWQLAELVASTPLLRRRPFSFVLTPPQCHNGGDHNLRRLQVLEQLVNVLHAEEWAMLREVRLEDDRAHSFDALAQSGRPWRTLIAPD